MKLEKLINRFDDVRVVNVKAPVKNLSNFTLDTSCFHVGLHHCFTDKNRFVKRNVAVELEHVAICVNESVPSEEREQLHEFLRNYTNKFSENIHRDKDNTFNSLSEIRNNKDIVILSGDKDTSTVIMNRADYVTKVDRMIEAGVNEGKYAPADDTILSDLKKFHSFLYRNFKKHEKYEDMRPVSSQPGRFFATAKTHKFVSMDDITVDNLTLRPIIDQTGTHVYKASQVISSYLEPLTQNKYVINNTLDFPDIIKNAPLQEDQEDVSYDVESLFTNIPVRETIDFILDEIYVRKSTKPFCAKRLTFKRLLERLTGECIFSVNGRLMKQIDGCQMGGPLSKTFSDIFMNKLERDVVMPRDPPLYRRYVDDSFNRRKKNEPDELFEALNSYHPNIRYTIEENPKHFLDTDFSHNVERLPGYDHCIQKENRIADMINGYNYY